MEALLFLEMVEIFHSNFIIKWGEFKVKEIAEWSVMALTTLTTLLTIGLVLLEFEKIDTTLLAGIIAFVGAIIGGFITLIGVKRTIESNRLIENQKKIKEELMFLYPLQREVEEINEYIWFEYNENHASYQEILKYVQKHLSIKRKLYDYAQRGSLEVYAELIKIKDFYDFMAMQIYESGEIEGVSDRKAFNLIQEKLADFQKLIRKEIRLKKSEIKD